MIITDILEQTTKDYLEKCKRAHHKPTYKGMGKALGISGHTIGNVIKGKYNGIPYGNKPSAKRCIDNKDFEILQEVFKGYEVNSKK